MKSLLCLFLILCSLPVFAQSADSFKVTFAGDYGATANTDNTLKRIDAIAPNVHFALGDLSYSQLPEDKWCEMVHQKVKAPFLIIPGNHESNGENGSVDVFAKCLPYSYNTPLHGNYPEQYYIDSSATKPLARFIMISPDLTFPPSRHVEYKNNNENLQWLKNAIADAKKNNIPWVILGMHKVCISTEAKTCEVGEELEKVIINSGVDIVLDGHVHAYERTKQLSCMKANIFDASCVANDGQVFVKGKGTVFITAGTAGVNLRKLNPNDSEAPYFGQTYGVDDNHYGPVELEISEKELKQKFIDGKSGEVLDHFTIQAK